MEGHVRWGVPKNVAYRKMAELRLTGLTLAFIASMHTLATYAALTGSRDTKETRSSVRGTSRSVIRSLTRPPSMYLHCHPDNGLRSPQNPSTVLPSRVYRDKKFGWHVWEVIPAKKCYARRTTDPDLQTSRDTEKWDYTREFVDRLLRICGKFNRRRREMQI